jgi:hypothetical protein
MAQGDLRGALTGTANSITNPFNATGSVVVSVGDLVYAVFAEQTLFTGTTVTDNLGNTYAAVAAAGDAGNITGRAYYSRVTTAGTLTTISLVATASANNASAVAAVIEGPFATSPLDTAPANSAPADVTSPFTCPSSGTLSTANEMVMCFATRNASAAYSATSPNLKAGEQFAQALAGTTVGYQKVSATTAVAPEFTGTNPAQQVLGTASFKLLLAYTTSVTPGTIDITGQTVDPVYAITEAITAGTVAIAGQDVAVQHDTLGGRIQRTDNTFVLRTDGSKQLRYNIGTGVSYSTSVTAGTVSIVGQTVIPVYAITEAITAGTVGIVGQTVTPVYNITEAITAGTVGIVGQTVNPVYGYTEPVTADTVGIVGQTVTPVYNVTEAITAGTVGISGQTVNPVYGYTEPVTAGTVAIVGQTVIPVLALTEAITAGTVPITGQTVTPVYNITEAIVADTVPITGQTVNPVHGSGSGYSTPVTAGTVDIVGQSVSPVYAITEDVTAGTVPISGQSVSPIYATTEAITAGTVPITGATVTPVWAFAGNRVQRTDNSFILRTDGSYQLRLPLAYVTTVTAGTVSITGQNVGVAHMVAPVLDWVTGGSDNTPDFDVDWNLDFVAGDIITVQYEVSPGFTSPTTVPYTLLSGDITAGDATLGLSALANGTYDVRVKITRDGIDTPWSNTETITIASGAYSTPVTAGTVPVTGATVIPLFGIVESLVAGTVPITGQSVSPVYVGAVEVEPGHSAHGVSVAYRRRWYEYVQSRQKRGRWRPGEGTLEEILRGVYEVEEALEEPRFDIEAARGALEASRKAAQELAATRQREAILEALLVSQKALEERIMDAADNLQRRQPEFEAVQEAVMAAALEWERREQDDLEVLLLCA